VSITLILALVGAFGALLAVAAVLGARKQAAVELHLDAYATEASAPSLTARGLFDGFLDRFNKSLTARGGRTSKLTEELMKADLKLRVSEYFLIVAGLMVLMGLIAYLRFRNPIVAAIALMAGYPIPGFVLKFRQRRRIKAFNNQLGDTIVLLSNALKAGYSFAQAMATIAKSSSPPMADEFARAVREMNLGVSVDDALAHMVKRIESEDFDLMVTAVQIHRVVGGNLAEILDTIAYTIRERIRIQGEIRTLTAQARASGYIITGLPFALSLLLTFLSPSYIMPLFHEPLGWILIGMGLFSIAIGYGIISKITNIEV
jgi:tight adherence protein B